MAPGSNWTETEKYALMFSILHAHIKKIEWGNVTLPEGRNLKSCKNIMDSERRRLGLGKGREEDDKPTDGEPSTPSKPKPKKAASCTPGKAKLTPRKIQPKPKLDAPSTPGAADSNNENSDVGTPASAKAPASVKTPGNVKTAASAKTPKLQTSDNEVTPSVPETPVKSTPKKRKGKEAGDTPAKRPKTPKKVASVDQVGSENECVVEGEATPKAVLDVEENPKTSTTTPKGNLLEVRVPVQQSD